MNREMIESDIEWIGKIPASWRLSIIGAEFRIRNEKVNDKDYPPLSVTKLSEGVVPQMAEVAKSDAHESRKLVLKGDFVINSRSDRKMSCGTSNYDGSVSLINIVLQPIGKILPEYSHYLFKNYAFAEEFYKWGHGIVADLWTTNSSDLKRISIPVPPIDEQQKVMKALNGKISQIDKLISNQEKQIEKLNEYKQSFITKAVTKGLDPNVEMKDSGVEWIGKIPVSFKAIKMKYIVDKNIENSFIDGDWIESGDITDEGIEYFTTGNIGDGLFKYTERSFISFETFTNLNCKYAYGGDLVISRLNEPYGRSCLLPNTIEKCVLAVDLVILRPNKDFNKKYICYLTQCKGYHCDVGDMARGTAMKRISRSNLGNIYLLQPPKHTQDVIVKNIDFEINKVDKLIGIKYQKIEKLQEYKKSLIYEYVTGKKQVA